MPHIHGVAWICPTYLQKENISGYLCDLPDDKLVSIVNQFITCKIPSDKGMKKVVADVQVHHHTKSCLKYNGTCRYGFPKLPSNATVIAKPSEIKDEKLKKKQFEEAKRTLQTAKMLLDDPELDENMSFEDFVKAVDPELTPELYMDYIQLTEKGKTIVMKRDVKERYVNNYNEEMLSAWNANMDIQLAIDPYAVISYMVNYAFKSEDSVTPFMKQALTENATKDAAVRLRALKTAYLTHRQLGASEAVYRVLPGMRLKDSNIACTFVTTGFPDNRSAFYKKCSDGPNQEIDDTDSDNDEDETEDSDDRKEVHTSSGMPIQIEGRTGMYTAATTVLERYVARPESLEQMCLAQFATSYTYQAKCPKTIDFDEDGSSKTKSNQKIFTSSHPLPRHIRLLDGMGLMRLRYYPAVLRFHTSKKKEGYEQYYSEMQLFTHWRNEEKEFHPENEVACLKMYESRAEEILNNKKAIFPGEETIEMLESANWELMQPTHLIETLDPQGEQEGNDDMIDGIDDDPEFESFAYTGNLNLSHQENCSETGRYKQIQVPSDLELNKMTQALVPEQMNVLRKVVSSCKDIVKARHNPLVKPKPVRLIVHGGAGVGKSKTIHSIARHAEKILRERGNNPLHPSVILCAFTAKAAKLIGGTTIHSVFGFKAGKEVTTLSDKRLVEMREHLAHLKLIVIDEISLVGADLLYRIHKRLTELFQTDVTVPFANVNMVLVGDLLQLPPVKETQVFKTPLGLDFAANKDSLNLWNSCEPMILKHNHRQGKEKEWANTLNRIRVGNVTEEDMRILKSRLTKDEMLQEYFMHLFFTNREVKSRCCCYLKCLSVFQCLVFQ